MRRPGHPVPGSARRGGRGDQRRAERDRIAEHDIVGRRAADVPDEDLEARRLANLDLTGTALLNRQLRRLHTFELDRAGATLAGGRERGLIGGQADSPLGWPAPQGSSTGRGGRRWADRRGGGERHACPQRRGRCTSRLGVSGDRGPVVEVLIRPIGKTGGPPRRDAGGGGGSRWRDRGRRRRRVRQRCCSKRVHGRSFGGAHRG